MTKKILIIIFVLTSFFSYSQKNKILLGKKAVESYYEAFGELKTPNEIIVVNSQKTAKQYVYNFNNGGWLIIRDNAPKYTVMAFNDKGHYNVIGNPFYNGEDKHSIKKTINSSTVKKILKSVNVSNLKNTQDTNSNVDAFLTDVWGGVNCKDSNGAYYYPSNHYTPSHCSPGCVAIATSQVLHYYEWPIIGVGNHVYKDNFSGTLARHLGMFDNHNYDWANMLDEYFGVDATVVQQEAIGRLFYDVGISVEMDYEPAGSTNNLNNVPNSLANYFRFSGTYNSNTGSSFWNTMYNHTQLLRPVPVATHNSANDEGHVFVVDGYKVSGAGTKYHVNWGWYNQDPIFGNTYNGWFAIQNWQAGDSGYDIIDGAIFNMLPEPQIMSITPTGSGNDFTVSWEVSDRLTWTEFTLEQKVDQESSWTEVASGITQKNYTISNPTGNVYQFRVKAKSEGQYYANSWSEREVYAISGSYNGYAAFGGGQHCYARQTPETTIDFTGDYTMETWLRVHAGNQDGDVIFDQKDVFGLTIKNVTASDYSVRFKSFSSGVSITSSGTKPLNEEWVHIAVSKTGNNIKLFINGEQQASASNSFNLIASDNALNIGEKFHGSYSGLINADFDQTRLSSVGRYASNFTPNQAVDFTVDTYTKAYFKYQNVHRNRLKDEAHKISVVAVNSSNYVVWKLDSDTTASISQQELNSMLKVYPNPTTNYITIAYTDNNSINLDELTFSVFDLTGKQVINTSINSVNNKIDLTNLTSGTYFLKVSGKDFSATQKIIKQ